jgi:xanthine dehydrogenase molybdopterin-binding subunit B
MLALSVYEALRDAVAAHTGGVPRVDAPCTAPALLAALGGRSGAS